MIALKNGFTAALLLLCVLPHALRAEETAQGAPYKPRLIVITDIGTEPDDVQSMVRLLTYANEFDIEGLIASTSRHMQDRVHPDFILRRIETYGEVLPNLRVHADGYPDAAALQAVVRGSDPSYGMAGIGEGKHAEAAALIIDAVDRDDPRPLWVSIWGGAAPLAQALWQVQQTRPTEDVEKFVRKLRVYSISDQDDTSPWARMTFPQLFWITSMHAFGQYTLAAWTGISAPAPGADQSVIDNRWLSTNVRNHGALGALYPMPMFIVEGDTPSFLYLVPNGLGNPERPDWGSWGGRWGQVADFLGLWTDVEDTVTGVDGKSHSSNSASVWRWREHFQNDFAARMDWSIESDYADANHPPSVVLNGASGTGAVALTVCPGETVALDATGTADPDGDAMDYDWSWYREVTGYYSPDLELVAGKDGRASVRVPPWSQPHDIPLPSAYHMHILLSVTDGGEPALTRYRRAVVSVQTAGGKSDSGAVCKAIEIGQAAPATDFTDLAPADSSAWFSTTLTPVGELVAHPAARAVLDKYIPDIAGQAASGPGSTMTLRGIQKFVPGLSGELLDRIDAELAAIPRPQKGDD